MYALKTYTNLTKVLKVRQFWGIIPEKKLKLGAFFHTHSAFVEVFNKELAKQMFTAMGAQEKVTKI